MLKQYLPTVLDYSRDDSTVFVADNASVDGSMSLLQKEFPMVKTILFDKNYGFAEGYNKALQQIDAEYYLLLNSDVEVTHHWLTPLLEFMDNHPEAAACQPKLLSEADKDSFEYAGACGGYMDPLLVILSVEVAFSIRWRAMTDSMIIWKRFSGQPELA
jgi:GT2 family glycosyltransferase